ncbi:hypothetical protein NP493_246g03040 [Ridgeia piscesae]|uniref:Sodium-dependent multivitamin transporter n=1 Tax=Ridgeia piscesae TaxID=27915 RepID=A0AAD9UDB4_RIDPI|nr:hypothetical protein NP493_246g03040 [Ridgeia piscesae]
MESVSEATMRFHWADYVVFSLTVAVSTAIGLYHGFTRRKNAGIDVYLMAGRRMPVLPVSLSHYVSWVSAISFLSDPVEVYYHGLIYWVIGVGYALAMPVTGAVFVPRYHRMKLTSIFKFLQDRFDKRLRPFASAAAGVSVVRRQTSLCGCSIYDNCEYF